MVYMATCRQWWRIQMIVGILYLYIVYMARTLKPTKEMLKNIDIMVIDLQDIGTRYYTFIWTMALVLQACAEYKKKVVILDRPNPINGITLEGPVLNPEYASFVGLYPIPVRHAMTIGELALLFNQEFLDNTAVLTSNKDEKLET